MSEQELYMMAEDRAKDEVGANNMLKKHSTLEKTVEDYAETIRELGERSRDLIDQNHPDRYLLTRMIISVVYIACTDCNIFNLTIKGTCACD